MSDSGSKKAFPLRISSRLFEQLRAWAEQDLRSINGQIEYLLQDAVRKRNREGEGSGKSEPPVRSDPGTGSSPT